ncbi:MAG: hypothetical protein E7034_00960 [Akkermansiaceae bacterium]|nr:hypothetical protein [Akkermansiaceae bacterium]
MDNNDNSIASRTNVFLVIRLLLGVALSLLCFTQLFFTFRGLDKPEAMDQAQIARQIARGEGMTTKNLAPFDVRVRSQESESGLDFNQYQATSYAPLHPMILSAAIRITGYHHFNEKRMVPDQEMVYDGDRVVAAVSTIFFMLALLLSYILLRKMFDEVLAATAVLLMGFSKLLLNFAVSGLAQPMLMCLFIGIVACVYAAIRADLYNKDKHVLIYNILAFILAILMCYTCRISAWCMLGLIVFSALYFRPKGMYAVIGVAMGIVLVLIPTAILLQPGGGLSAAFQQAFYGGFGVGNMERMMRSTDEFGFNVDSSNFFLRLLGATFSQSSTMYEHMGSIIVTPFFLLSLFNRYRNPIVNGIKWLVFSCWICSCAGMALFGETSAMGVCQISTLFTPFFTAYGISLVFIFLARLQISENFVTIRSLTIAAIFLISSGVFLFEFPRELQIGVITSARGIPQYPPYYPNKLNGELHDISNPQDIIVTDQPWAVAWYADRKALWLPTRVSSYTDDLEPVFKRAGQRVQGFLITPTSHSMPKGGVNGVISRAGEFAPLALEGKILQIVPKHNLALAELFNNHGDSQKNARPLANLVSSQGQFPHRNFILGAEMVYYSRDAVKK